MTTRDSGTSSDGPLAPAAAGEEIAGYPRHWEADILLSDGSAAHLRPIKPTDEQRLIDFYARVSPESKYLRFFAPYPVLSDNDVHRFTHVDYHDRVAFILTIADDMLAVGRYDKVTEGEAEVAFLVEDSVQGKGAGTILLEHLAQAGRECDMRRFVAEVLPQNRRMAQVFSDAGYTVQREFEDGMIIVEFPISPTEDSVEVMQRREHAAESISIRRLLNPASVAIFGTARRVQAVVTAMLTAGYRGKITAVASDGKTVWGVPTAPSIAEVQGDLDVVMVTVPWAQLPDAVKETVDKRAFGMFVLHSGESGGDRNVAVVDLVRSYGLRALGPDALGVINTDRRVQLNASPAPMPRPGVVGMFSQSSSVGVILLSHANDQNLGLSTFVTSGMYADVTGNDVMQYWLDDHQTEVCLLSVERIGNPRKFSRIARELASKKPVILFSPGSTLRVPHLGAAAGLPEAPEDAVNAMFRQAGIIVCDRRSSMYDVAQVVARQPLPKGNRVRVITNSTTMARHVERVGLGAGLDCSGPLVLSSSVAPADFADATREALADPRYDSVFCGVVDMFNVVAHEMAKELRHVAQSTEKPLVAMFADFVRLPQDHSGRDGQGKLPTFSGYTDAIEALGQATRYGMWRVSDHGEIPEIEGDWASARELVDQVLAEEPEGRELTEDEVRRVLGSYNIEVLPLYAVSSCEEAIARAKELTWNVVLKATDPGISGRPDQASVFRHIDSESEMKDAWGDLGKLVVELGLASETDEDPTIVAAPLVQPTLPSGVPLELKSVEDPAFGPIVSVGVHGLPVEILEDIAYRVPPLTSVDASNMLASLKAAPLLYGYRGSAPVDVAALEKLIHQLAQLADAVPQLAEVVLTPCMAAPKGVWVAGASILVAPTAVQRDELKRSLSM